MNRACRGSAARRRTDVYNSTTRGSSRRTASRSSRSRRGTARTAYRCRRGRERTAHSCTCAPGCTASGRCARRCSRRTAGQAPPWRCATAGGCAAPGGAARVGRVRPRDSALPAAGSVACPGARATRGAPGKPEPAEGAGRRRGCGRSCTGAKRHNATWRREQMSRARERINDRRQGALFSFQRGRVAPGAAQAAGRRIFVLCV